MAVRVMVELGHTTQLASRGFAAMAGAELEADLDALPSVEGVIFDPFFAPTPLPSRTARERSSNPSDLSALFELALSPEESTYLVRAEMEESSLEDLWADPRVVGVFADPVIESTSICPASAPLGSDADVERLLGVPAMRSCGMTGRGVLVAIVDTGINIAYLAAHGKHPNFDAARSWTPRAGVVPGSVPVDHGTMCAFDVCIAAPQCTLLDIALLQSSAPGPNIMSGLLSDAVRAYRHLINVMTAPQRPGEGRSLVVNNSWGMFHPSWDFPVGHPSNYSNNPNHPFNRIVGDLERSGADILFAAGNCGANCPDGRCRGITNDAIYGANGHPAVLCVAGVDTTEVRVGYSSIGPGRLTNKKPDISGYTHFSGSGVYPADGGTSAATPVVAGVIAAVRSKRPFNTADAATHPAAIRMLLTSTAKDLGSVGYDYQHGYGVVSGPNLVQKLCGPVDICRRFPQLCIDPCVRNPGSLACICRRFPNLPLCRGRISGIPRIPGLPGQGLEGESDGILEPETTEDPLVAAYLAGYLQARAESEAPPVSKPSGGCGCGCGGKT